jgi:hypothetical protein
LSTSWAASVQANWVSPSQVNIADSTSNDFWITGLQLETGSSATDFEFVPYDYNLRRCLRYYTGNPSGGNVTQGGIKGASGVWRSSTVFDVFATYGGVMRAQPTITISTATPNVAEMAVGNKVGSGSTIAGSTTSGDSKSVFSINGFTGATAQNAGAMLNGQVEFDAEL